MDLLNLFFWFICIAFIGYFIVDICAATLNYEEKIMQAFPLGVGCTSTLLGIQSIFKIPYSKYATVALLLFLLIVQLFRKRKILPNLSVCQQIFGTMRLQTLDKVFIGIILIQTVYAFFTALIKPWASYDGLVMYSMKAKLFYFSGGIPADFVSGYSEMIPNLQYPLLVPFAQLNFYLFQGYLNDSLVNVLFPIYSLSLITCLFCFARREIGRTWALGLCAMLATVPQYFAMGTYVNTDVVLSFYFTAGVFYLHSWLFSEKKSELILGMLYMFLTISTKTEGVMLLTVSAVSILIFLIIYKRKLIGLGYLVGIYLLALVEGYLYATKAMNLNIQDAFPDFKVTEAPVRLFKNVSRMPKILYEYQRQIFQPKRWNIVWVIFLITILTNVTRVIRKKYMGLGIWLLLVALGYTSVYLLTQLPLTWHLSTTSSRFLIHLLPLAVLYMGIITKDQYDASITGYQ